MARGRCVVRGGQAVFRITVREPARHIWGIVAGREAAAGMMETIQVRVRAFAGVREALGFGDRVMAVRRGTDVAGLLAQLDAEHPGAKLAQRRLAVAVNRGYVSQETVLAEGDEIALIPPVSGGAGDRRSVNSGTMDGGPAAPKLFEVTDRPLSLDEAARRVTAPDRGGITLFAGTVRGVTHPAGAGDTVVTDYLEYEAYPEMAEPILARIAAEVRERWPEVSSVSIVHRTGRLAVGETAVVVAVAAAHRENTFAACKYAIDRVKQIAPIWKREVGSDGAVWVEGPESDPASL